MKRKGYICTECGVIRDKPYYCEHNPNYKSIITSAKKAMLKMMDECSFSKIIREPYLKSFIYYLKKELTK